MQSLNGYIYKEELNNLMNTNIQEGLFDALKNWGNRFFNWLFKGKKSNIKLDNNDFSDNGLTPTDGFDSNKIKDIKTYYNEYFNIDNLMPLKSVNEKSRTLTLIKSNPDIFKDVPYKEELKEGYNLIYIVNKDDKNHILEDSCGIIFYKLDGSIKEDANEPPVEDENNNEENKEETKGESRLYIKLFYVKNIYFELNRKLAKEITDRILSIVKEGTQNEVKKKDFLIIELPLNDKNYKDLREHFGGKGSKEINKEAGTIQYKLKY